MLSGGLGAGKTQFAQGFAQGLGIREPVVSPTFNIVLTYPQGRVPLYHFDLYRLEAPDQLEDIAFFETVEGDGASLIEWGELFPDDMPDDHLQVSLTVEAGNARTIEVAGTGPRGVQLAQQWAGAVQKAQAARGQSNARPQAN